MTVTAALITKNEEENIESCLESIRWADEIVMIDSGSTDRTVEKAKLMSVRIYEISFRDFASQKNAALERATGEWVFFIDADERVPRELADEITDIIKCTNGNCAYRVKRSTYFFGKRLRFSATQGDAPIRLFPRSEGRFHQPVHEEVVTNLPIRQLKNPLIHFGTKDLSEYEAKVRQYVPLEVQILRQKGKGTNILDLVLRPPARFCYLFFWRLGFLDGWTGLQFAALSGYYCFMKYWNFIFPSADRPREILLRW